MLGVRETRHIEGEYVLTADDLKQCKVPDSTILIVSNAMDQHSNDGGGSFINLDGRYYSSPYETLVPKKIDNLLVAGRAISADSIAVSSIKMMPNCMGMGQAAGTAAAMAVRLNKTPKQIDVLALREKLKKQNVFLGEKE